MFALTKQLNRRSIKINWFVRHVSVHILKKGTSAGKGNRRVSVIGSISVFSIFSGQMWTSRTASSPLWWVQPLQLHPQAMKPVLYAELINENALTCYNTAVSCPHPSGFISFLHMHMLLWLLRKCPITFLNLASSDLNLTSVCFTRVGVH